MMEIAASALAALSLAGSAPAMTRCDLDRDAIAWGDDNIFLKSYPGGSQVLFVAMSINRPPEIPRLAFAPHLRFRDRARRHAVIDLMVERLPPGKAGEATEDFVMLPFEVHARPRSVTIRCGKDVLSRTNKIPYGN